MMKSLSLVVAMIATSIFAQACPTALIAVEQSCNNYLFYLQDTPVGNVSWNFGDGNETTGGIEIFHEFPADGIYVISATFSGPDCPEPFMLLATVEVSCGAANECPTEIWSGPGANCGVMNFEIGSFVDGENVIWYPGDDTGAVAGGHFFSHTYATPGTYTVCAFYTTPLCPDGVELCTIIVVEPCSTNSCPTEISSGPGAECGVMHFEIGSFVDGENVVWYPGDETGAVTGGHFFSHTYATPGTYTVCAFYTTPLCPDGVELCTEVTVENCNPSLCPTGIEAEAIDCDTYVLHIAGIDSASVIWDFGDGVSHNGGINADHTWSANGVYIITATVDAPQCPIVPPTSIFTFVYTVEVNCTAVSNCPSEMWSGAGASCGVMNFEIGSFVEGENVIWYPGDETGAVTGGHFFSHTYAAAGNYTVCAFYTTPLCPEGVELCTEVTVESCTGSSCPTEIWAFETADCGVMEFELDFFNEGNVIWYPGDESGPVEGGQYFSHNYEFPGIYTVCAVYTSASCPNGGEICTNVIITDCNTQCNDVVLGIDSYMQEGGTSALIYNIFNAASGMIVAGGEATYTLDDPFFDAPLCLPDGCYYLSIDNNQTITPGQNLNVFLTMNGANLLETAEIIAQDEISITYFFGVNSDCIGQPECFASFETVYTNTPGHVEFINTSSFSGVAEFTWDYGNGTFGDTPGGNVQYETNGVYTVCLTVTAGTCQNTYCNYVIIENMEVPCSFNEIQVVVEANYLEPMNELLEFAVNVGLEQIYQLYIEADGILNDTLSLCIPDGCYEVSINSGLPVQALSILCSLEGENIQQLGELQLNTGETTTSAAVGVNMDCTIDVTETSNQAIIAFPNPASHHIQFSSTTNIACIEVFDFTGKRVISMKPNQLQTQLNTVDWSCGLYVAHITCDGKKEQVLFEIVK